MLDILPFSDLFCGCSRLSFGFAMARFELTAGTSNNDAAFRSYWYDFKSEKETCKMFSN